MILRTFRLGLVQQWFYRKVLKKVFQFGVIWGKCGVFNEYYPILY